MPRNQQRTRATIWLSPATTAVEIVAEFSALVTTSTSDFTLLLTGNEAYVFVVNNRIVKVKIKYFIIICFFKYSKNLKIKFNFTGFFRHQTKFNFM